MNILQGSVVTHAKCDGVINFNDDVITSLMQMGFAGKRILKIGQ